MRRSPTRATTTCPRRRPRCRDGVAARASAWRPVAEPAAMTTAESARASPSGLPRHNGRVAAAAAAGLAAFGALSIAAATIRPGSTLVGLAVAALVATMLWRVDVALLLVVATGPLEL